VDISNYDHIMAIMARERQAKIQHEAEVYRLLIERANLRFGPSRITRARRALARLLTRLADNLEPCVEPV
jgi:hypothetical protein